MLLAREKRLSTKTSLPWRLASLSALAGAVALAASLAGVRPAEGQTAPPSTTPAAAEPPTGVPLPDPNVVAPTVPRAENPPDPTAKAPTVVPAGPGDMVPTTPPTLAPQTDPAIPVAADAPPRLTSQPSKTPKSNEDVEAAILREIKNLQDQLRALEAKRGANNKTESGIKDVTIQSGARQIKIVRADDQGKVWIETWTTDDQGRPGKILQRSAAETRDPTAIGFTTDGKKIMRAVTNADGSRSEQILDAATGKVISENIIGAGSRPGKPRTSDDVVPPHINPGKPIDLPRGGPTVEYPIPVHPGAKYTPTTPRVTPFGVMEVPAGGYPSGRLTAEPAGVTGFAKGSQQLDLVSLATSYADAVSVLEAAEAKAADIERLGDSKTISQQEVTAAKLALSAAKRKEQLLQGIAQVATDSAAQEVEMTSKLFEAGQVTASAATEAKARLGILKQILATRSSVERDSKKP